MSAYPEMQFENKAICLSVGESSEHRLDADSAKNNDECTGMKPACTSTPMMIPDSLFPPPPRRKENVSRAYGLMMIRQHVP